MTVEVAKTVRVLGVFDSRHATIETMQGYRQNLKRLHNQVNASPEIGIMLDKLKTALPDSAGRLKELAPHLALARELSRVDCCLRVVSSRLAKNGTVIQSAIDLVQSLQEISTVLNRDSILTPTQKQLLESVKVGISNVISSDRDNARTTLQNTEPILNRVVIEVALPALKASNNISELLQPFKGQPILQKVAKEIDEVLALCKALKNEPQSDPEALISAVNELSRRVPVAPPVKVPSTRQITDADLKAIEQHLEDVTGVKPSFKKWCENFRHFESLVMMVSASDQEITGHNAAVIDQYADKVNKMSLLVQEIPQADLVQFAGMLREREGYRTLKGLAVIEDLVRERLNISPKDMQLMSMIGRIVELTGQRRVLERERKALVLDRETLAELGGYARITRDNKLVLSNILGRHFEPSSIGFKGLFQRCIEEGKTLIPKKYGMKASSRSINRRLERVEPQIEDLKTEIETDRGSAVALVASESDQGLGNWEGVRRNFNLLSRDGYFGSKWGAEQIASAAIVLDGIKRRVSERSVNPVNSEEPTKPVLAETGEAPIVVAQDSLGEDSLEEGSEHTGRRELSETEEVEFWRGIIESDAKRFGINLRFLKTGQINYDKIYSVLNQLASSLGQAVDSEVRFDGQKQGDPVVCRIMNASLKVLLDLSDRQRSTWINLVTSTFGYLRYAETFLGRGGIAAALKKYGDISGLQSLFIVNSKYNFHSDIRNLRQYVGSLEEFLIYQLQPELDRIEQVQEKRKLLEQVLSNDLYSGLLPDNLERSKANLAKYVKLLGQSRRGDLDHQLEGLIEQFKGGIQLISNHGDQFLKSLVYVLAYGWGSDVGKQKHGITEANFIRNLRSKPINDLSGFIEDCTRLGIISVWPQGGRKHVTLHNTTDPQLNNLFDQIVRLRKTGAMRTPSDTPNTAKIRPSL